jgi:hypothetical protein
MTKRYGDPILVAVSTSDQPRCFIWRGTTYRVTEVLARWHLQDRWSEPRPSRLTGVPTSAESDRQYYRLECVPQRVCKKRKARRDTLSERRF